MAGEVSRKVSVRRITAPNDDSVYVDLKIIDQIRFVDPQDKYQEWELSYENNLNAGRQVRVVEVGEDNLQVERVDFLRKVNTNSGFQEWENEYNNGDDPPVHYETHKKKIYALEADGVTKNESVWIEVQRIDKIIFKDPKDHYQEKIWELKWPDLENEDWDYQDLTDPVTDWDGTSINPPWRLDPYQTIVDCSFGGQYMLVLYGNNQIAGIEMSKIATAEIAFARALEQSSFGSPVYWKTYSGPVYYQVAQVKPVSTVHAVSTQLNFSSSGVATATRGSQQFVYNVSTSLLQNAEATETITQDNCAVGAADTYGTYAVTRPYFEPWVTTENYYNGVDDSWRAFDDYFGFFTIAGITPLDNRIYYKSDTDWFLFGGPVINATASKIYNERGDEFSVGTTITKTASGITTEHNADDSEFLAPVSDNRYPYTGYVDTSGVRKGVWTTAIFSALNYSDPIHTYLDSPTIESDDPGYPDLFTYRSTDNNSYESKTGNGSTLEIPYWSKENNLDVLKLGETVSYSTTGEFPVLGSRTVGNNGYWTQFSFPYSTGANMDGSWWYEQYEEDDNEIFPCLGATIVTPYGQFDAPAANFSFMPWMSLHNGEHTLQAWSIRTAPNTHTRYIYLDGVEYGSTLATALGVSVNDIRAVFFDIKKSDIAKLR